MSLAGVGCLECTYFESSICTCECNAEGKGILNLGSSDKEDRDSSL